MLLWMEPKTSFKIKFKSPITYANKLTFMFISNFFRYMKFFSKLKVNIYIKKPVTGYDHNNALFVHMPLNKKEKKDDRFQR